MAAQTQDGGQVRRNNNALAAAEDRLGRDEAAHLAATFAALDPTCKNDWAIGNRMIRNLLVDGFSHNQIRQLLRVGATRIRRIAIEIASSSSSSQSVEPTSHSSDDSNSDTNLATSTPPKSKPAATTILHDLRAQVSALESQLASAKAKPKQSTGPVPWKEVALVMQTLRQESVEENRRLWHQTRVSKRLLPVLRAFASHYALQHAVTDLHWSAPDRALRHATVVRHPAARRQGLDWLTNVVYHNTDRAFAKYFYPHDMAGRHFDGYFDFSVQDEYTFVVRSQIDLPISYEAALPMFQHGYIRRQSANWTPEEQAVVSARMHVTRLDSEVRQEMDDKLWYLNQAPVALEDKNAGTKPLCRVYYEPDRVVMAGQTITQDELLPTKASTCKKVMWVTLERMADGQSRVRALSLVSSTVANGRDYTIEEEALERGWDLSDVPEHKREQKFVQLMSTSTSQGVQEMDTYMAKIVFPSIL